MVGSDRNNSTKNTFGLRGNTETRRQDAVSGSIIADRGGSKFGDDLEKEKFQLHNSAFDLHWPKFIGAAGAVFALLFVIYDRGVDRLFTGIFVAIMFGGLSYFFASKIRDGLNAVHSVRTIGKRTIFFKIGALAGLTYFAYSTFVSPETFLGVEFGLATAFSDGFDRGDLGAVAILLLECAGFMVVGGVAFEYLKNRFF